jgi:hypothetical protein
MGALSLWDPIHATLGLDVLTAFLLGLVHGITPDEHTWPITFSYAVGGHSARKGLRAGLTFSLAFAVQQALASELAYLGLASWLRVGWGETAANLAIGLLMATAGLVIIRRGRMPHLHLHASGATGYGLKPWMPAVHGFVAGWAVDPFSIIIFTVLAPAMPSAAWGWVPGLVFGLGTACVQAAAGAIFGRWAAGRGLAPQAAQRIALRAASRSLLWGGAALLAFAILGLFVPDLDAVALRTGLHVHNLDEIGLPTILAFVALAAAASAMVAERRVARRSGRAP